MASVEQVLSMSMDEASKHPDALAQIVSMGLDRNILAGRGKITPEIALRELLRLVLACPGPEVALQNLDKIKAQISWPKIYHAKTDSMEYITSAEVKQLEEIVQAYGRVSEFWNRNHSELRRKLDWPEMRGGATSDGKSK